jgi:hypothetical protein
MESITILNHCHHHRGFVYQHARFGADNKASKWTSDHGRFILSPDLTVRFVSVDQAASCVSAAEILRLLREGGQGAADNRKGIVPGPATFFVAIRSALRLGATQDPSE